MERDGIGSASDKTEGPGEGVYGFPDPNKAGEEGTEGERGEEEVGKGKEDDEGKEGAGGGVITIFKPRAGASEGPNQGARLKSDRNQKSLTLGGELGVLSLPGLPLSGGRRLSLAALSAGARLTWRALNERLRFEFGESSLGGETLPPIGVVVVNEGEGGKGRGQVIKDGWKMRGVNVEGVFLPGTRVVGLSVADEKKAREIGFRGGFGLFPVSIEGREGNRQFFGGALAAEAHLTISSARVSTGLVFGGRREEGEGGVDLSGKDVFGEELWRVGGGLGSKKSSLSVSAYDKYSANSVSCRVCLGGGFFGGDEERPMGLLTAGVWGGYQNRRQLVSILASGLRELQEISGPTFTLKTLEAAETSPNSQ